MCGICGQLSWGRPPDCELVGRMTARIAHRGPDGEGLDTIGPVSLGHRRLAVIDLSPAAKQPMADSSGLFRIVFNGEIYNFKQLRKELSEGGARFQTQSDTEVILEAYKRWGLDGLTRLNGMFAFALWDHRSDTLLLARDRAGEKPLYYRPHADGGVTFASELKALFEDSTQALTLNPRALSQYLSLNYTLTSDAFVSGVEKLRPGHYALFRRGRAMCQKSYWDIAEHFHRPTPYTSPSEAAEALTHLVDDAVRLRLVSDVPLGVLLSGGVDSSALAAAMCQALAPGSVRSFSMGFQEESFSEVPEARAVAAFLGVDHRDTVTTADVASLLPRIVYYADEPFADTSMIPMYLLSEFARRHVTVCLAGDGGDEVFGGYETYVADKLHHALRWCPRPAARTAAALVHRLWPVSFDKVSVDYKLRQFLSGQSLTPARAHYHWRTIFSEAEKRQLLRPAAWQAVSEHDPFEEFERFGRDVDGCDHLSSAFYVDLKTWLPDDILVKADRASMAHGLELRAPLLDHRIIEFAASLPARWKVKGLRKKHLFKMSQRTRLPGDVLRRPKRGFNAPVSHWLLSSFKAEFEALTTRSDSVTGALFDPVFVRRLWDEHRAGHRDHGHKLLGLINLHLWCRQYPVRFN